MHRTDRQSNVLSVLALTPLLSLLALAALAAPPAEAQSPRGCGSGWSEPVVCDIELVVSVRGERERSQVRGDDVPLRPDAVTILSVRPTDQFDRGFPARRFAYELEIGRACGGLVEVTEERVGEIRLVTGDRTGSCELAILPANNLNLDQRLDLRVEGVAQSPIEAPGAVSGRSEVLATWLYRALLGREPEPEGLLTAAEAIERGRLEEQVETMLRSPEFAERRRGMSFEQLLSSLYQGLLGRDPDTAGVQRYRDDMRRGEIEDVVLDILESDELAERLGRQPVRR